MSIARDSGLKATKGGPRFVETGKEDAMLANPKRFGWDAGAIVSLEIPGDEPLEIDIHAAAVPVLVGWSRGKDVSRLAGPVSPPHGYLSERGAPAPEMQARMSRPISYLDVTIALDPLSRRLIWRPKRRVISGLLSALAY